MILNINFAEKMEKVFENGKVFEKGKVFETLNEFSSRIFFSHPFMFNIDAAKQHGRSPSILFSHHNSR
jgi:hypothetical protein